MRGEEEMINMEKRSGNCWVSPKSPPWRTEGAQMVRDNQCSLPKQGGGVRLGIEPGWVSELSIFLLLLFSISHSLSEVGVGSGKESSWLMVRCVTEGWRAQLIDVVQSGLDSCNGASPHPLQKLWFWDIDKTARSILSQAPFLGPGDVHTPQKLALSWLALAAVRQ